MHKNFHELRIGISSSHGTGKTTLAESLSKVLNVPVLTSDLKKYWESWGVDDFNTLSKDVRTHYQWKLLQRFTNDRRNYLKSKKGFVSDRTPHDFWGYTQVSSSMNLWEKFIFWNKVKSSARLHRFDFIIFLKPEFPMVQEKNRGDALLQKQIASSVKRCLYRLFDSDRIIEVTGDPKVRVNQVLSFIQKYK